MRHAFALIGTLGLLVVGSALPLRAEVPTSQPARSGRTCALGSDTAPSGLVVVLPSGMQHDWSMDLRAIDNPLISGVAVQINWRDLEPVQGVPNWALLDRVFAAAEASHKWVQLLIFPGFFSPAWALRGAETDRFAIPYGPGHGELATLPMPWDRVYLDRWFAFLQQLSARYGGSPAFRVMAAAGPTSVSAEMTLPHRPDEMQTWAAHGYSPRRYLDAWEQTFRFYADHFPNQCISVSGPGLPILDNGRVIDRAAHERARQAIVEQALRAFGPRLVLQWSDLHAGQARVEAPDQTAWLIGYSGRIITGLQMRTSAQNGSAVMGAPGNPAAALRMSIDKGLALNRAGRHVNYLEVYEPDVLAPDMQPVLQHAASLLAR
jgi:hypothetical protein